jgi:NADH:ubiquinone oxidoreductase subunit K
VITLSACLTGAGLICALYRRTVLGVLIGIQIMFLGTSLVFVAIAQAPKPQLFSLLICLNLIPVISTGLALAVRLFYIKESAQMNDIKGIKN